MEPTKEELFFAGVQSMPLSEWENDKLFIAADDKAVLIFDQQGLPPDPTTIGLGGKCLSYQGIDQRLGPDGNLYVMIIFKDRNNTYMYNTGKTLDNAKNLKSDQLPMLIDSSMIDNVKSLIEGRQFWIKSPLWYDNEGNSIDGMKYIPVNITDVKPGNSTFPLKLKFEYGDGQKAWVYMNFGNSGIESRSFPSLFSLSDIKNRYPSISEETWDLICKGKLQEGMTKDECKLSLGNPNEVNSGHDYSQTLDLWHYSDGSVLWFEDGLLTKFRQ